MSSMKLVLGLLAGSVVASGAAAGVITQEFTLNWNTSGHNQLLSVSPFVEPIGTGPLTSVTVSVSGYVYTQLSGSGFSGSVPLSMTQSYNAAVGFNGGDPISGINTTSSVQNFNITSASPWFAAPSFFGAAFLPDVVYTPGDAAFDLFNGAAPIELSVVASGGTTLLAPTPSFIGATTGTEWIITVSYAYVPSPGALGALALGALAAGRRRR